MRFLQQNYSREVLENGHRSYATANCLLIKGVTKLAVIQFMCLRGGIIFFGKGGPKYTEVTNFWKGKIERS